MNKISVFDKLATRDTVENTNGIVLDSILITTDTDEDLEKDLDYERHVMDNIHLFLKDNNHPVKAWYYGHYHYHKFFIIEDIKYYLLDMGHNGNFDMVEMI